MDGVSNVENICVQVLGLIYKKVTLQFLYLKLCLVYGFEMKLKFFDVTFDFRSNGIVPIECILLKFVECTHLEGVYLCDKYCLQ